MYFYIGEKIPANKILPTYYGYEYNKTDYAYKATMKWYYGYDSMARADYLLRTHQNLLENEPYTPYLDTFNVTGLLGGKYLVFVSFRSANWEVLQLSQIVYFLRKVCLFFNFWIIKCTIMSNST